MLQDFCQLKSQDHFKKEYKQFILGFLKKKKEKSIGLNKQTKKLPLYISSLSDHFKRRTVQHNLRAKTEYRMKSTLRQRCVYIKYQRYEYLGEGRTTMMRAALWQCYTRTTTPPSTALLYHSMQPLEQTYFHFLLQLRAHSIHPSSFSCLIAHSSLTSFRDVLNDSPSVFFFLILPMH